MATEEIDDSLYSRQRYVLGDNAMQRMAKANVLLFGMGGLGVEIAKNLVLAGIKSLTIQDAEKASHADLGTNFFLSENHVTTEKNRSEACVPKLAELNPYVTVRSSTDALDITTDLDYLKQYQCVILTEASLSLQLRVDAYCRTQEPPIKFISSDVYGVACSLFCDFGDSFEVVDSNGEEPKESFIANITKANPGVVTSLENRMHGFEDGDSVMFKEIKGMDELNGKTCKVKVLSPYAYSICDTSGDEFGKFEHDGVATQIKVPKVVQFESLEKQLIAPNVLTPDLSKFEAPYTLHIGFLTLHKFKEAHKRLPNIRCKKDAAIFLQLAESVNSSMKEKVTLDESLLEAISFTSQGCFAPLCTALGGIAAQEALKALTGKFTPLMQWLYLDATEVLTGLESIDPQQFQPRSNRYDSLRICIGEDLCRQMTELKLFMVGCGAIGCEMIKNYAMLGIGTGENGKITITDNDLIEKSNLNRQFLFRPHHIQKAKSSTAAQSALEINPGLHIDAHQHKVCPQTESTVYTDEFFSAQDLIVNALDNLEARRYVDSRCVTNQKALLESGTMGAKGHVQVIVPHLTESYGSQRDPPDEDIPYCTLKSFPAVIEHCIQWARDKFESQFNQKPSLFNKFWAVNSNPQQVIECLSNGTNVEGVVQVSKILTNRPTDWTGCVALARIKFEKNFNHKAQQLLHAFPLDTKLQDGSLFWQSPKRPPNPIEFDLKNNIHFLFVTTTAKLLADICGVPVPEVITPSSISATLENVPVPQFKPSSKAIVTDENESKPDEPPSSVDDYQESADRIQQGLESSEKNQIFSEMKPLSFEKDDDSNGHIDFIFASSNLRAAMYGIETADRLKTKRIAGRIVPAIATTTAAVAGLVTIELVKVVKQTSLDQYKNCFLNLALPVMVLSEPGKAEQTEIKDGMMFTLWDRWEVRGNKNFTLNEFVHFFKGKYDIEATMVVHGVKMIYVPVMPGHKKRLTQSMLKLIKPPAGKKYVDLVVSFENTSGEDVPGPPVRYFFE